MTARTPPTPLVVSVTSDSICPFCFIGLKKLEAALASSKLTAPNSEARVFEPQIRFLPFELDASLPRDCALDKRERYSAKFGPHWPQVERMMVARAKEVGIKLDYSGPVSSTFLSHRLMEKAYQQGGCALQCALVALIFPAYFEKQQDLGSPSVLARYAVQAGVFADTPAACAFLRSNECAADVNGCLAKARAQGIPGVPHFSITAGSVTAEILGAQESEHIDRVIRQMADRIGCIV